MLLALVSLALAIDGASDIWFSYQEQKALLFRVQREQASAAAEKISQFLNEISTGLAWEIQLPWSHGTFDEWQLDAVRLLHQVPALNEIIQVDAQEESSSACRGRRRTLSKAARIIRRTAFVQAMAEKVYYGPSISSTNRSLT